MPTISMFYGILVLMYFRDNQRHNLPHIHVRYQGEEAAIAMATVKFSMEACPRNSSRWCRRGSRSTRMNCLSTGSLPSMATSLSGLLRFSEVADVD